MRKLVLFLLTTTFFVSCNNMKNEKEEKATETNPFLTAYNTPFEVPPFDKIKVEHYKPAIEKGMEINKREIDSIANNPAKPTFENTVEAVNNAGQLLFNVDIVFSNLLEANRDSSLQAVSTEMTPKIAAHYNEIYLNAKLFERIKFIYNKKDSLKLNTEQIKLVEKYYKGFVQGGALLKKEDQEKLKKINQEITELTIKFSENLLAENNKFKLIIDKKEDLAGLPQSIIDGAYELGKGTDNEGKWIFTLDRPSIFPFLTYSNKRDLREKIYNAYINKCNNNDGFDNKKIVSRIVSLRYQKAKLLGYKNYSELFLDDNMAKNPTAVYKFLNELMTASLNLAKNEAKLLQDMIKKEGGSFELKPWDWFYYSEKVRKAKYDLDEEIIKPYFKLDNVKEGMFNVATKLYGITFVKKENMPIYQKDVEVYEVFNADKSHLGLLYMDYYPRPEKRGGAWCTTFRYQYKYNGKNIRPIVSIVTNFSRPTGDKPALLNADEVITLFHEFGHALHNLFSDITYQSISGTSVARDFVELPSQVMENWAREPEVIKSFAKHYKTGKVIPQELLDKIKAGGMFNQGFENVEYLAASILDMDWHTITDDKEINVLEFENKSLANMKLISEIVPRYRSTYFAHIFAGGYASGYYSYIWAAVLDSDAFQAFKEKGLFDKNTADSFKNNILSKGGSDEPMKLYLNFRGKQPSTEPLKRKKGLIK